MPANHTRLCRTMLATAAMLAMVGQAVASPFGAKLAVAPRALAVPTSAAKTAEMKKHAVSAHSDAGKKSSPKPLANMAAGQGLQGLPGMGGMAGPSMGDMGASTSVDGNDPAAALTDFIAPEDAPKNAANGTLIEDSGVIGADGKRQGQLAPPPDFTFPIIFFSITAVIMVAYFTYSCCFAKEEKRAKGDSYM